MNVNTLPAEISQSVECIIDDLYDSNFGQNNVDLNIQTVGILNYTVGMKLRLTYIDTFQDDDIDEWKNIAIKRGASSIKTKIDTSSGYVDLNIEYKRLHEKHNYKQWIIRSGLILLASWSYHQLHLLESDKYPLSIEWFK